MNKNDVLGSFQVYNGAALGFNSNYTVKATMWDETTYDFKEPAQYDVNSDRLIVLAPTDDKELLYLADIQTLQFDKKA